MKSTVPEHAAVLVIDAQRTLFCAPPAPLGAEAVIEAINTVTAKARRAGAPVFLLQHDGTPDENLVPFTDGWKLHPKLHVEPDDRFVRKTTCDAFYETPLENELRSLGITALVLTGYATEFCVDATLRNAVSKNFRVLVVSNAHTTHDNPVLAADQVRRHHNWAWANCVSKAGVVVLKSAEIRFAAPPEIYPPPAPS